MKKATFKELLSYLKPYYGTLFLVVLFSTITVVTQVIIPIQIGRAVNAIVGLGQVEMKIVVDRILVLLLVALLSALTQFLQEEFTNRLSYKMAQQMRQDLFNKIQSQPLKRIDQFLFGDVVSRVMNDVDLVGLGLKQSFTSLFTGIATIIGVIVMMLSLNVRIGLVVIILTPLSLVVSSIIANRTYHYFQEQVAIRGEMSAFVDEMANNQMLVQAFQYEDPARKRFDTINKKMHVNGVWSQFYGALINPTARVINSFVYAAVGILGAFTVINGGLSVGVFSSFLAYANQYTKPFNEISAVVNEMQTALAAAHRVFSFLAVEDEVPSRNQFELVDPKGQVTFDNVDFSYRSDKPLIEDLNLEVEAGKMVAIVGPTGAGKTTLINLLMRFYDQQAGRILIDGIDSLDMNRSSLRRQFGMVLQDSWIFKGTIRDNIAYGKPEATDEEVVAAAKKARIHENILQTDHGYQSMLEEDGSNISTGQKQLLCIARIMLTDPEMLILDEATSSIDSMTELAIQRAFDEIMVGRTSFVVAHRLSTIQRADTILYMEAGKVLEQGSHEALLERRGKYYDLYQSQFEVAH